MKSRCLFVPSGLQLEDMTDPLCCTDSRRDQVMEVMEGMEVMEVMEVVRWPVSECFSGAG